MKTEFYKLYKSKLLVILPLIVFIAMFAFSLLFLTMDTYDSSSFGYEVTEYENFEEVKERIDSFSKAFENLDEQFENGKITNKEYNEGKEMLTESLAVYQFIYDNNIEYNDAKSLLYLGFDNKIAFVQVAIMFGEIVSIAVTGILIIYTFCFDFQNGTVKFVYSNKKARMQVFINKVLTIIICFIVINLLVILCTALFSIPYDVKYKYLIEYFEGKVYCIEGTKQISNMYLNVFVNTLPYLIFFLCIALVIKNPYLAFVCCAGVYLILNVLFTKIPNDVFMAIVVPYPFMHSNGINESQFFIALVVKYIILTAMTVFSVIWFKKKDLV